MYNKLIFELSRSGRGGYQAPGQDTPQVKPSDVIPADMLAENPPEFPEVSELDLVRHYTHLSRKNFGVDTHFYPLGSCTMKYNPKVNERVSRLAGFAEIHPYAHRGDVQGAIGLMVALEKALCDITGMSAFTLQPSAGAQGEFTAILMIRAYFNRKGEKRDKILIPDSAHGTNPASAVLGGFRTVEIASDSRGNVDLESLKANLDEETACLMLTMPNTLGLFDENMLEISSLVHEKGAVMYMDGANLNAVMGITRPRELGFDIMHVNLHKTFSTPHGGGGPGSGPVGVADFLADFLPNPRPCYRDGEYRFEYLPDSIGRVKSFYGNFLVMVKAYAYILSLGGEGIRNTAQMAVLNANYLKERLKKYYHLKYDRACLHEFVLSALNQKEKGVTAKDVGKRLLDFGIHAPTTYFPLIVEEALMVEPTETESPETMDRFVDVMKEIHLETERNPELVQTAPHTMPVTRVDEVTAARKPVLKYEG